jgi:hypothetical protein
MDILVCQYRRKLRGVEVASCKILNIGRGLEAGNMQAETIPIWKRNLRALKNAS